MKITKNNDPNNEPFPNVSFVIFPNLNKVEVEVEVKNIMECLNGSTRVN